MVYALSRAYEPVFEAASREIAHLKSATDPVVVVLPVRSNPLVHRVDSEGSAPVVTTHPLGLRMRRRVRTLVSSSLLHVFAPLPLPRRLLDLSTWAPSILTAVSVGELNSEQQAALNVFRKIVVESDSDAVALGRQGVVADRLHTIAPCTTVPLLPPATGTFTVVFASWPFEPDEVQSRGLDLLADAARSLPDMAFRVLTRPGSRVDPSTLDFPANVQVDDTVYADASDIWRSAHAVVAPFRAGSKCKSVPNSVVDAIGAGRPAVVGEGIGLAPVLTEDSSGLVAGSQPGDLTRQLKSLRADYELFATAARECTRLRFDLETFRRSYRAIYNGLRDSSRS